MDVSYRQTTVGNTFMCYRNGKELRQSLNLVEQDVDLQTSTTGGLRCLDDR